MQLYENYLSRKYFSVNNGPSKLKNIYYFNVNPVNGHIRFPRKYSKIPNILSIYFNNDKQT